jgi:uncharacterized integral membrane protein
VWVVKGLLFLILLIVLVVFFVSNSDQTVDLRVVGRTYLDIPIFWIVIVSFLVGFTVAFLLASVREIRHQQRLRKLRRDLAEKEREIGDLRTLPIQDLDQGEPPASPRSAGSDE